MSGQPSTLITGIGELVTNDTEHGAFAALKDAALVIAGGTVAWTGPASRAPAADTVLDASGRAVLPGFADSHAHLVFAGERSAEFAARMAGLLPGGRHPGHGRGDPRRPRRRAAGQPAAAGGRDAPAGHDHVRVQVRVRAYRA